MGQGETLTLDCPLCGLKHQYNLAISRQTIRYFAGAYGPWYDKEFTRLFVCPSKNAKFQATIVLSESRENLIESVEGTLVGSTAQKEGIDQDGS